MWVLKPLSYSYAETTDFIFFSPFCKSLALSFGIWGWDGISMMDGWFVIFNYLPILSHYLSLNKWHLLGLEKNKQIGSISVQRAQSLILLPCTMFMSVMLFHGDCPRGLMPRACKSNFGYINFCVANLSTACTSRQAQTCRSAHFLQDK